jgi:hypothetical protein
MKSHLKRKKGSILVFVLGLLVLLSALSIRLIKETTQELRHVSQFYRKDDLRIYAYSCLDLVVGVVNEWYMTEGRIEPTWQFWDPLRYADKMSPAMFNTDGKDNGDSYPFEWEARLLDETGKIPLFKVDNGKLSKLFAAMMIEDQWGNYDEEEGQPLLDSFKDWQDSDNEPREEGAEDEFYENLEPPYFTPGRKIYSYNEFQMIRGFGLSHEDPDESGIFYDENGFETKEFKEFKDSFSFYNEDKINPFSTTEFIIRFLADFDEYLVEELLELRGSGDSSDLDEYYRKIEQLAGKAGLALTQKIDYLRIEITIKKGKSVFKLHAILEININQGARGQANQSKKNVLPRSKLNLGMNYPFRILALKENENLID